jgi:hypothetical protein
VEEFYEVEDTQAQMSSFQPRRLMTASLLSAFTLLRCTGQNPTGNADSTSDTSSGTST